MILRHDLGTDAQICGIFASQASFFVHYGRDVNRVYSRFQNLKPSLVFLNRASYGGDGTMMLRHRNVK